jgi:hypothetical protein
LDLLVTAVNVCFCYKMCCVIGGSEKSVGLLEVSFGNVVNQQSLCIMSGISLAVCTMTQSYYVYCVLKYGNTSYTYTSFFDIDRKSIVPRYAFFQTLTARLQFRTLLSSGILSSLCGTRTMSKYQCTSKTLTVCTGLFEIIVGVSTNLSHTIHLR